MNTAARTGSLRALYLAIRDRLERLPMSLILLGARLAMGGIMFRSGMLKLNSPQFSVTLFRQEYQVPLLSPEVALWLTTIAEVGCGVLLFLGLATRLATIPLFVMAAVIQLFVYPEAWVERITWVTLLVLLLTRGAGVLSLDYLIERWFSSPGKGQAH